MGKEMELSWNNSISLQTEAEVPVLPETVIGTRGLRKMIVQEGISWQTPVSGDEVEVHYNVRLQEGEYFDSSREKGAPFRFKLGQCEVIEGWDEGIATMRKGERAVFTIPPELAYGQTGSPPIIPPNATLIFDVELISWWPVRDICWDGGILKKITREGEGWATPNDADEVLVKYIAKNENGVVVSKSEEGLEFSLTNGHLCPAMSRAVKTMRKGEKAELCVKFSYGLRHCGDGISTSDGIFPPYPDLIIHLELVSWRTVVDVIGEQKILKKITEKGEAFDRPDEGSIVKVVYIGKLEDGTVFERQGSEEEPFEYMCAEEQIHDGLDRAVLTMRKGEEAVVKISSEFLNASKDERLSSVASVLYDIKLIDFVKEKPFWKMDAQERITACEAKKNEGNILFKAGKFQLASKNFVNLLTPLQASKYVEYSHSLSDDEKHKANTLRFACYLNDAACKLKLGEDQAASRLCTKVLQLDPCNVKALFRRSQAYMRTSDLEKAEEDINRALAIDPNNKDVKIKLKELREKQRQYETGSQDFQHHGFKDSLT
ncbi:Peptidyl-prolyl cis-trans isomerase FKBP65 [Sesamum angolense]|uniref:peptidylprolyl isomerase n=1 Tax=Sesamum angolense TaxID=2727404 RepID=A0AAE1WFX2_9LAMI|nr:Peptidyl-prolyl cis-trans isomerase FKBP65 [Sesamum angolense]